MYSRLNVGLKVRWVSNWAEKERRKNKFAVIHELIYYFCDID